MSRHLHFFCLMQALNCYTECNTQHGLTSIQVLPWKQQQNNFLICCRLAWHSANIYNLFLAGIFDKLLENESYNQTTSLRAAGQII